MRVPATKVWRALVCVCLLVSWGAGAEERSVPAETARDAVMAQVDDEPITAYQVDQFLELRLLDEEFTRKVGTLDFDERRSFLRKNRRETLEALIDQRLLLQEAKRKQETMPQLQQEVEFFLNDHMKRLERELGLATLERELARRDKSIRDYRREQRDFMLQLRFLFHELYSKIHVRPTEIAAYYAEHPAEFSVTTPLRYRQMWFHSLDHGSSDEARAAAERVRRELQEGADWTALWRQHSFDRDSKEETGGLRTYADWSALGESIASSLQKLDEGGISDVLEFDGGWRILKLETKPGTRPIALGRVQRDIEEKLTARKRSDARDAYVNELRKKAYIRYFSAADGSVEPGAERQGDGS